MNKDDIIRRARRPPYFPFPFIFSRNKVTMGSSTWEKGVLKLVHPGRHVEYHKQPITAAEVMKRNPRHCVARPDVFKYPWIVVRPESVLMPGKVFYIVPNLTLHRLLKAWGQSDQATQNQSPNSHDHSCIPRRNSPFKSCAGTTPKHQFRNISQVGASLEEQQSDGSSIKISHFKSNICGNTIHKSPVDSSDNIRPCQAIECGRTRKNSALAVNKSKNGDQEIICCQQVIKLKSCMRKKDSIRKWLKLRVTFDLSSTMTPEIELPSLQQQE